MSYTKPTQSQFESHFERDFPFGDDLSKHVTSNDIKKAFAKADASINLALFSSQESFTLGYMLLSAHHLVTTLRASSQGLNGQFDWLVASKGVGSVSVSHQIPSSISENPIFAMYTKTNYGAEYLMMVYPMLCGGMSIVAGGTQA